MGLWDFVKSAGELIGIGGDKDQAPKADDLKSALGKLGLPIDGLDINVDGDTVKVAGQTISQELKEKIVLALGNVAGVAKVDEKIDTPAGEVANFYTVKSGDTLSNIAKDHYGAANKYMTIFEANRPMLSHPDKIYPGQVLRIPKAA